MTGRHRAAGLLERLLGPSCTCRLGWQHDGNGLLIAPEPGTTCPIHDQGKIPRRSHTEESTDG